MESLVAPSFNLLIILSILFYFLREPVMASIRIRHHTLADELGRVRKLLHEAEDQNNKVAAKLRSIDQEIGAIKLRFRQDLETNKIRILNDGKRISSLIVADARASAARLYDDLKSQLYFEMGAKVIDRAETLLRDRLTGDDRKRIRDEFSRQLETFQ